MPNPILGENHWSKEPYLDKICPNVIVYHASHTPVLYQMTNR